MRRPNAWWVVLAGSVLVGTGAGVHLATGGVAGAQVPETTALIEPAQPAPSTAPETARTKPPAAPSAWPTRPAAPPSVAKVREPERLRVDSVGLDLRIDPVGVDRRGQMALPERLDRVGWYRYGAAPGDPSGVAVLAGHVDSERDGIGPLASLAAIRKGSDIVVAGSGRTTTYRVIGVQRIAKAKLDTAQLFARGGRPLLRVVTCGGSYDPKNGYADNVVVTAEVR